MTSLFPHSAYAEDQPYSRTILRYHVLRSGLVAGSFISLLTASISTLRHKPISLSSFASKALSHSYRGTLLGAAFGIIACEGRMYGREEIEWQDRSWRLLASKGQVEVDDWLVGGGIVGVLGGVLGARSSAAGVGMGIARTAVAGLGLGAAAGTVGYMAWRYGVHGGKWPGDETEPRILEQDPPGSAKK